VDVVVSLRTSVQISFVNKSGRVSRKVGKAVVVEELVNNLNVTSSTFSLNLNLFSLKKK
jgi:hypothetical protein